MDSSDTIRQLFSLNLYEIGKQLDPVWSGIISTLFIGFFGYISQNSGFLMRITPDSVYDIYQSVVWRNPRRSLILTGQKEQSFGVYNSYSSIRCNFTNRFRAFWNEVSTRFTTSTDILTIQETSNYNEGSGINNNRSNDDIFLVSQRKQFLMDEDLQIYAVTCIDNETTNSEKRSSHVEKYNVILYSYHCTLNQLTEYIDDMTETYMKSIEEDRQYKRFCYTLTHVKSDEGRFERWTEQEFKTTSSFDNMFFDEKTATLDQLDFFTNNVDWYYDKGIQHSIGFGLHGPPGTGKTSFIKCLAKKTNRHIVSISLKLIKSKRQLEEIFFESHYNHMNRDSPISFDKKIIVFEDIDCIGDIVIDRDLKSKNALMEIANTAENKEVKDTIEKMKIPFGEEPLTLDDFLNLLDGVRETPGRIIVLTSNHYDKLDKALTRPGRIDCTIHMQNISHSNLQKMCEIYFGKKMMKRDLEKIKERSHSPAEIINLYTIHKNDMKGFIQSLQIKGTDGSL